MHLSLAKHNICKRMQVLLAAPLYIFHFRSFLSQMDDDVKAVICKEPEQIKSEKNFLEHVSSRQLQDIFDRYRAYIEETTRGNHGF